MTLNTTQQVGAMTLLPAKEGTCPECAVAHDPTIPHDQQSLYYQMRFYGQHHRWPTWNDAMAHCSPEVKAATRKVLKEKGIPCGREETIKDLREKTERILRGKKRRRSIARTREQRKRRFKPPMDAE